jgi:serine/threonine-protein kinase
MPFALLLDDGTQCRIRIGGAEAGRDDGLVSAYWCHDENSVLATPAAVGRWLVDAIIDRSHPLWTVKVGQSRMGNLPPPQTRTVSTAWFAGN